MSSVPRPQKARRSERWMRDAAGASSALFNDRIRKSFAWPSTERIEWLSPVGLDEHAEYSDREFVERLGVTDVRFPLHDFWPPGGPRWDGLARTDSSKVILVEAKAYIEEAVDCGTRASPTSAERISSALARAKAAFRVSPDVE